MRTLFLKEMTTLTSNTSRILCVLNKLLASMTAISMPAARNETDTDHSGGSIEVATNASTFIRLVNARMVDEG